MRRLAVCVLCVLLLAGCRLVKRPGWDFETDFKIWVEDHPRPTPPRQTLRDGTTELTVQRVVINEHRTVLGPDHWTVSVYVVIRDDTVALLGDALISAFQIIGEDGNVYDAMMLHEDKSWLYREHTGKPTHLPRGTPARIRLQAQMGTKVLEDEPAVLVFRGKQLPLR